VTHVTGVTHMTCVTRVTCVAGNLSLNYIYRVCSLYKFVSRSIHS